MIIIGYAITFCLGFLTLKILFPENKNSSIKAPAFFCLSWITGLSLTIIITFCSFILLNHYNRIFIISAALLTVAALFFTAMRRQPAGTPFYAPIHSLSPGFWILLIFLGLVSFFYSHDHPFGGWDAWQVWNFKAKFLFLGGSDWKSIFDPVLWRSSPHYPLALPLFHVWTWSFGATPIHVIPMFNAVLFNILIGGSIFAFIFQLTENRLAYLPAVLIHCIPSYLLLATSQYADILIGLFLIAGLLCIIQALHQSEPRWLLLAGLFAGMLGFTKPEGLVAALLIAFFASAIIVWKKNQCAKMLIAFWGALAIAGIPAILFNIFLSPGNQTFINGLTSPSQPSTWLRLKIILAFFMVNFFGIKWNGIWLLLLTGALLNLNRLFQKSMILIPLFFCAYLGVIILYYWVNSYFPIEWWLAVSAGRILTTLLPVMTAWVFAGILQVKKTP